MEVDSDTTEIETDYSRKYSLGITAFDLDLDEALEQNLLEQKIKTFTVIIDKYQNTYTIDKPELLVQALEQPADEEQQEIDYTEVEMEEEPEQEEEKPFGEKPSTDPLMP